MKSHISIAAVAGLAFALSAGGGNAAVAAVPPQGTELFRCQVHRGGGRDTCRGVPYMRSRYFGLDLVERLGLMDELLDELFGRGGIWEINDEV